MSKKKLKYPLLLLCSLLLFYACVESFNPPAIDNAGELLVIDASVNGTTGTGTVKLSTTSPLDTVINETYTGEAQINIEDENNQVYPFQSNGNGEFSINGLNLTYGQKLRLNVTLDNGTKYQSEYVVYKKTPEIDSVSWKQQTDGIQFYVTTHDPQDQSIYYKWDYEETWEFNSRYLSMFEFEDSVVVYRKNYLDLYICYQFDKSHNIIIGSSEKLQKDVISEFPLAFISTEGNKFLRTYSILVKQRTLTKEAYDYWKTLKTNTESLGGLFDPQPSQLKSNIVNVNDPAEDVLGYFQVYSQTEKRLFIERRDLENFEYKSGYEYCTLDSVLVEDMKSTDAYLLVGSFGQPTPEGYTYSSPSCVDCRKKGTNVKPSYWP